MTRTMPTLKAIHLQFAPAVTPKIAKEYVLPTLTDKQDEKEHRSDITIRKQGFRAS